MPEGHPSHSEQLIAFVSNEYLPAGQLLHLVAERSGESARDVR